MTEDLNLTFYTIPFADNYEVNKNGFFRNKHTKRLIKGSVNKGGYKIVKLNNVSYYAHQILARMFIENPNELPCVDHINHIRTDNRIENLRWTSYSTNLMNKSSNKGIKYEFLESIPTNATQIYHLNGSDFDNLFYYNKEFYIDCDVYVRKLYGIVHCKQTFYSLYDLNNKRVFFSVKQFLEYYPEFIDDFKINVNTNVEIESESHSEGYSESYTRANTPDIIQNEFKNDIDKSKEPIEIINEIVIEPKNKFIDKDESKSESNSESHSESYLNFMCD